MADDFASKRLADVYPQCIGFDCLHCRRHAAVEWGHLQRRFKDNPTLGEIALKLATVTTGNPCLSPDSCLARPVEMPVETWANLGHAYRGKWRLHLECGRTHEGLKTSKACRGMVEIDVRTLYAYLNYDYPLHRLRLRCPGCLSHLVHLSWTVPPPPSPSREEVARLPNGRPVGLDEEAIAFNTALALGRD